MRVALLVVAVAFTLSGCGSGDSVSSVEDKTSDGAATEATQEFVSLTGTFRVSGGPTPGIDEALGGTVTFDGPVTETAKAVDGAFTVDLPPGEYTVSAQPTGDFATATCPSRQEAVEVARTRPLAVACFVE